MLARGAAAAQRTCGAAHGAAQARRAAVVPVRLGALTALSDDAGGRAPARTQRRSVRQRRSTTAQRRGAARGGSRQGTIGYNCMPRGRGRRVYVASAWRAAGAVGRAGACSASTHARGAAARVPRSARTRPKLGIPLAVTVTSSSRTHGSLRCAPARRWRAECVYRGGGLAGERRSRERAARPAELRGYWGCHSL